MSRLANPFFFLLSPNDRFVFDFLEEWIWFYDCMKNGTVCLSLLYRMNKLFRVIKFFLMFYLSFCQNLV